MPGIGLVIDGAVQQAPQPLRQASGEVGRVMVSLEGGSAGRGEPSSISFMLRAAAIFTAGIAYRGRLAVDIPGGPQAGELLALQGSSAFTIEDGKISVIVDRT